MSAVITSQEGPVTRLTLNRPEKLNAFNDALVDALSSTIDEATDAANSGTHEKD